MVRLCLRYCPWKLWCISARANPFWIAEATKSQTWLFSIAGDICFKTLRGVELGFKVIAFGIYTLLFKKGKMEGDAQWAQPQLEWIHSRVALRKCKIITDDS